MDAEQLASKTISLKLEWWFIPVPMVTQVDTNKRCVKIIYTQNNFLVINSRLEFTKTIQFVILFFGLFVLKECLPVFDLTRG